MGVQIPRLSALPLSNIREKGSTLERDGYLFPPLHELHIRRMAADDEAGDKQEIEVWGQLTSFLGDDGAWSVKVDCAVFCRCDAVKSCKGDESLETALLENWATAVFGPMFWKFLAGVHEERNKDLLIRLLKKKLQNHERAID